MPGLALKGSVGEDSERESAGTSTISAIEKTDRSVFRDIIGQRKGIKEVFRLIERVADSDSTVMVYGESGSGKELVARAVHEHSYRKNRPFVPINCGAIPENLLESELFGHVRGAFTGATSPKPGKELIGSPPTVIFGRTERPCRIKQPFFCNFL